MLKIKRAYEPPSREDGKRILVDRLWPRGLTKDKAALDEWDKELAPSNELRRWYGHRPERWDEFKTRYAEEIRKDHAQELERLRKLSRRETVTLLFSSREPAKNNAAALKEILEARRRS
jgi:uncharacterized protein YeaO (DUF488 family)